MSNNYINDIIVHEAYDFSDEEIVNYYIVLLKSLSLQLNSTTLHFFFDSRTMDFPLCSESVKFLSSKDNMIRIAVRTITLNVYRIGMDNESLSQYLFTHHALSNFSAHVSMLKHYSFQINQLCALNELKESDYDSLSKLVDDHLDYLFYLQDILFLNIEELSDCLCDQLLGQYIIPVLIGSLIQKFSTNNLLCKDVAIFLLGQIFFSLKDSKLINSIISVMLKIQKPALCRLLIENPPSHPVILNSSRASVVCKDSSFRYRSISEILLGDFQRTKKSHSKKSSLDSEQAKEVLRTDLNLQRIRSKVDGIQKLSNLDDLYADYDFLKMETWDESNNLVSYILDIPNSEKTIFWAMVLMSTILDNRLVDFNILAFCGFCPYRELLNLKLFGNLLNEETKDVQFYNEESSQQGLTKLLNAALYFLNDCSMRFLTWQVLIDVFYKLCSGLPREKIAQLLNQEQKLLFERLLLVMEEKVYEIINEKPENMDLSSYRSELFNVYDEEVCRWQDWEDKSFESSEFLQRIDFLQGFNFMNSKDFERRIPFTSEEKLRFYLMAYKMLLFTLEKIGFGSITSNFVRTLDETEYPFYPTKPFDMAQISLGDIRECFILSSNEDDDDLKPLFAVFKDGFLLLLEKSEGTVHASVDTAIFSLRSTCIISDTEDTLMRVQVKSKRKPCIAAKPALSNSKGTYKQWNLSILFTSSEDAIEIAELMNASKVTILKEIFEHHSNPQSN